MADIKELINRANTEALERLLNAEPHWIGIKKVIDAVPGMKENYILHSGPPIGFKDMLPVQRREL